MNITRNNVIAYTIDKAVFGNLYITINNGEVVVKAPWYCSKQKVQDAIKSKSTWILKKIREYEKNKIENNKYRYTKILGINYAIKITYKNIKFPNLNLKQNYIEIELPYKLQDRNNSEIINKIITKMYEKLAEKHLENIMEKMRIKTGLAPENYYIKNEEKNIARCDFENRNIYINPKIMELEDKAIEYILLHELCHLKYKTHAKGFYEILKKNFPKYKKYENILKDIKY